MHREDPDRPEQADAESPARTMDAALRFGRDHAAVVALALIVAVGLAMTHLMRAHTTTVPVAASVSAPVGSGSPTSPASGAGASASRSLQAAGPTTGPSSGDGSASAASVTVQVLGAVARPGVVTLPGGSRVQDAVRACGGLTGAADPGELNLAAVLQDADQVIVGTRASPRGEVRRGSGSPATGASGTAGESSGNTPVDLNRATVDQLDQIPGVGPVTAQRIIAWRTEHGQFTTTEQLQEIDGIGPKTYARMAPYVRV